MPLVFNTRHLEKRDLVLEGELSAGELDLLGVDELIEIAGPVTYHLLLERMSESILVQGTLECTLTCQCVRCLTPFAKQLSIPNWTRNLAFEGEDRVQITNDCVDLTPYVREDILLAFPQHPLCEPNCRGLLEAAQSVHDAAGVEEQANHPSSAWSELNKLKF